MTTVKMKIITMENRAMAILRVDACLQDNHTLHWASHPQGINSKYSIVMDLSSHAQLESPLNDLICQDLDTLLSESSL